MKKIVALALCLVLALSLCATAFASVNGAVKTESIDKEDAKVMIVKNGFYEKEWYEGSAASNTNIVKVEKWSKANNVSDKGVETIFADCYTVTLENGEYFVLAKVAEGSADCKVTFDGVTFYAVAVSAVGTVSTSKTVSSKIAKDSDKNCGAYVNANNEAVAVYMIDGDPYLTDGNDWAIFNGEFVDYNADATVYTVKHTFKTSGYTYKSNTGSDATTPVTVECSECGNKFDVIKIADKDKNLSASYYQDLDSTYTAVIKTSTSNGSTTTATGVTSAKTFDAGIAMYVGMSIMAVTGSAVVIGKKKEF